MVIKRSVTRWIHIAAGCLAGIAIYSPLSTQVPVFALITKICVLPVLVISGLYMWKQGPIRQLLDSK